MSLFAQAPTLIQHTRGADRSVLPSLVESILAALIYADLFDYPLSIAEIVRYQVGTRFSTDEIRQALARNHRLKDAVIEERGFYALKGRGEVFALRRLRSARSRRLWARARVYGRLAACLPFVRAVAVTGALAVKNIGARPDIDLLIVSAAGRVWLCRRGMIVLVRLARLFGDDICPNYIISENRLELDQRDFFTAHELAQMAPLAGGENYWRMISSNRWALRFLPATFAPAPRLIRRTPKTVVRRGIEAFLLLAPFDLWERWELARMQKRLRVHMGREAEVVCSPDQCKGHTGLHRQSVLTRYTKALEGWGLNGAIEVITQQSGPS